MKYEHEPQPVESLDLGGDGDDVEILYEVERAFGVTFTDEEVENCVKVGDLFDVLCARIPHAARSLDRCHTAAAYYALRRAIRRSHPDSVVTPALALGSITHFPKVDAFFDELKRETGLDMPTPEMGSVIGSIVMALLIGPFVGLLANKIVDFGISGWVIAALFLLCIAAGIAILRLAPGHLPGDCRTLGNLARVVAAMNFARLNAGKSAARKTDLWNAYSLILRRFQGITKPIARETLFF